MPMDLINENGITKTIAKGFSWKSFFFGIFYQVFRGEIKGVL
tara:strand:+ start:1933 stop:2058 length:126 start_codon:yes stop_codon:yes gene_type:complete